MDDKLINEMREKRLAAARKQGVKLSDDALGAIAGGYDHAPAVKQDPLPPEALACEQYSRKPDFDNGYCRKCGKVGVMAVVGSDDSFLYEKCGNCGTGYKAPWSWILAF